MLNADHQFGTGLNQFLGFNETFRYEIRFRSSILAMSYRTSYYPTEPETRDDTCTAP